MNSVWDKIINLKSNWKQLSLDDIYPNIMNKEYLLICYYNLYEKYIRGGISQQDWDKINQYKPK